MSVDAWVAIGIAVASGFGVWMFRIDRIATTVRHLADSLNEHKTETAKDSSHVWAKLENHGIMLGSHGERIAHLESWKRGNDSCK